MSITFTPTAGTWITFNYYIQDDGDEGAADAANGVIRFDNEEPSVQCHNSGGLWLVDILDLAGTRDQDEWSHGQFEAKDIDELLMRVAAEQSGRESFGSQGYEQRKLQAFREMLLHCKYHACGFHWG